MRRFFFMLIVGLTTCCGAQVVTPNESVIQMASPKKVGINLNGPTYYGAGELYKNLMWRNPGFEPDLYRDKFVAFANGTTTTFTAPSPYDPVVANFWTGATFQLYRGSPKAQVCTGTIASNTTATPTTGPTYTFAAPCATAVTAGDVILLRKNIGCTPEADWESGHAGWWPNIANGGKLISECTAPYQGQQSLRLDASAAGSTAGVNAYIDTASWDLGVLIDGQYTISGYYKTIGSPVFSVSAQRNAVGPAGNPFSCPTKSFAAAPGWTAFSSVCTGSETNALPVTSITVSMTAHGGIVLIDNVSFQKSSGTDPTNTTPFRDELLATLNAHCAGASLAGVPCELRDWAGQSADEIENTIKPLFTRQPAVNSFNYDYYGGSGYPSESVGFEEFLELCKAVNAEPYYTLPETTESDDAADWIEYLNGPSSSVYGALRAANGQTASWLTVFPTIHLPMGNENWNEGGSGEGLGYRVAAPDLYYDYSTDAAGVWTAMRADPSWPGGGKGIDLVLNFQDGNANYGVSEAMSRTAANSGELAPYTQFYVGDTTPLTSLWDPLLYEVVANTTNPATIFDQQANAIKAYGKLNVYEYDNATTEGPANVTQAVLDSFTDAAGYGTATALQSLEHLSFGIVDQNFFSLSQYYNPGPNGTEVHNWGAVIDMGGATNAVRPQELGMRMVNAAIIGPMYSCPISSPTTYNLPANHNGYDSNGTPAANNIPQEYAFCFLSGTQRSMVIINTDITNAHSITFAGAEAPSGAVTVTRYAPASISDTNEAAGTAVTVDAPQNVSINAPIILTSPGSDTLPPYSINRYDWISGATTPLVPTTTTLSTPSLTPVAGTSITLTATVAPAAATGSVTFLDGTTTLGTMPVVAGVAAYVVTAITTGTHSYTAVYSGDATYASSTSAAVVVIASLAPTTTTLSTPSLTPVAGTSITLTATVAPTAATGSVTFLDGATTLGTMPVVAGAAAYVVTAITTGTHSYTAVYSGDTTYASSTSAAVVVNASLAPTTTTLSTPSLTPVAGTSITLTATVAPTAATSSVTFLDGATTLGTMPVVAGVAAYVVTAITTGTHSYTAVYSGDTTYASSTSAAVVVIASRSPTTTTLSTPSLTPVAGTSITLTATVAPAAATGSVTFLDGTTTLGTMPVVAGVAAYVVTAITTGTHSYTAVYSGDATYASSTSAAVVVIASLAPTTTTLSTPSLTPVAGTSITLTATVAPTAATGSVTFLDGATTLGTMPVVAGAAAYVVTAITTGTHSYTAVYSGDTTYASSTSAAVVVNASLAPTTTTLSTPSLTPVAGTSITLTATVAPATVAGSVTFLDGATTLGTVPVVAGVAIYVVPSIAAGTHSYTAAYGGDTTYASSTSAPVVVIPSIAPTTTTTATTLAVTAGGVAVTSVAQGTAVTLTATVTSGGAAVAPGQVEFCDATAAYCTGAHLLGLAQLTAAGTATWKFVPGPGTHSYKAVFVGTNTYAGSTSTPATLVVVAATGPIKTTVGIQASGGQGDYALLATVATNGPASPTGQVSFADTSNSVDPNYVLGTATLGPTGSNGITFRKTYTLPLPDGIGITGSVVAVADFNGDGIPDLVVTNSSATTLSILLGNGDGTFTSAAIAVPGNYSAQNVVTGDFNGDGKMDFALVLSEGVGVGAVTIYLGNGDGTFTAGQTISLNVNGYHNLLVGDFNGDGIEDLIVGDSDSSGYYLQAYFGNGDGTFAKSPLTTPVGNDHGLGTPVVADFNGDGKLDLALPGLDLDILVLLGNGDGTFTAEPQIAVKAGAGFELAVADLNGDGKPDLVTAGNYATTVLLGNGDGTFTALPDDPNLDLLAYSVVTGDFNGDGIPDLVLVDVNGGDTDVFLGRGNGTFIPDLFSPSVAGFGAADMAVADFNGDGQSDIAEVLDDNRGVDPQENQLDVLLSQSPSTAAAYVYNISPVGTGIHNVDATYAGDMNNVGGTSGTIGLLAQQVTTNLTLTANPSGGSTVGQSVTLAASLSPATPQQDHDASGNVVFSSNGKTLQVVPVGANGVTTLTTSALTLGADNLKAVYLGDTNFLGSTSAIVPYSVPAAVTGTLTASPEPSPYGTSFTLTATLTPPAAGVAPTGMVTFSIDGAVVGSEPVAAASGGGATASYTIPAYSYSATAPGYLPGAHTLTAAYAGDANYNALALSGSHTVTALPSDANLTDLVTPIFYGQEIGLTNGVNAQVSAGVPAVGGSLYVYIDGALACTLQATVAGAECPDPPFENKQVGTHEVVVSFSGDDIYAASTSIPQPVQIVPDPTATTLSSSPNPSTFGENVTLTATTSNIAGFTDQPLPTPVGAVVFYDGSTAIGSASLNAQGVASLGIATLSVGAHNITSSYATTVDFTASSSGATTQQVDPAPGSGFTMTITPTTFSTYIGVGFAASVSITETGGYSEPVQLSCSGLPSETTCAFDSATIAPGGGVTRLVITPAAPRPCNSSEPYGAALVPLFGLLTFAFFTRRRRLLQSLLVVAVLACVLPMLNGCGGNCTDLGTKPGSYTFRVTGTATGSATGGTPQSQTQAMKMTVTT